MSLRADVKAALTGDATLVGLLPGGIYASDDAIEITRQATPAAFDANGEILPCAFLRMGPETPVVPHPHGSRFFFHLYFYSAPDAAIDRVYQLLHRQRVGAKVWQIEHADTIPDQEDQALNCPLTVSRYYGYRNRE